MPTTVDLLELRYEESPRYEGAPTTNPYRISTVARNFPLQSARISPNPTGIDRSDELRSIEGGPPQLLETYEPDGALSIRAYADDLIFLLPLAGWAGVGTAGNGIITDPSSAVIPTGAHRWVFNKRGGLTAKTAQLTAAYSDEGVFVKGQGYGISGLSLNSAGDVAADLMGLVYANIADPNLTATYPSFAIPHFRRGDMSLTWLASSGVTDDFSISISNPLERVRTMGLATPSYFPDQMIYGDDRVRVSGSIPKRTLADADIDALLAFGTFAATVKWTSPKVIGATSYKYQMWFQMPACQIVGGGPDELANRRRFGGNYDWWAAWDETAGYDCRITIVGSVTTVETLV
jgi:hypothetical protein